jgi:hypothetical protein
MLYMFSQMCNGFNYLRFHCLVIPAKRGNHNIRKINNLFSAWFSPPALLCLATSHCLGTTTWCNLNEPSLRKNEREREILIIVKKPWSFPVTTLRWAVLRCIITHISFSLCKVAGLLTPCLVRLSWNAVLLRMRTSNVVNCLQKIHTNRFITNNMGLHSVYCL